MFHQNKRVDNNEHFFKREVVVACVLDINTAMNVVMHMNSTVITIIMSHYLYCYICSFDAIINQLLLLFTVK